MAKHKHDSHGHDEAHGTLGHILPFKIYLRVFITLGILTVITVAVAKMECTNFGALNIVIAMLIASAKALVVALFFMHLKYENPLTWLYAAFPIVLLFLLIGGIYIDGPLRHEPAPVVSKAISVNH